AGLLVNALFAAPVGGLADARRQRERTFEHADNLADGDVGGFPPEQIAPALPLLAVQQAVALELEQDGLEEFLRKLLPFGQFRDEHGAVIGLLGEQQHRLDAVLRLPRQHSSSLYRIGRVMPSKLTSGAAEG